MASNVEFSSVGGTLDSRSSDSEATRTSELKKDLEKFGMKRLKRRQTIKLLETIYGSPGDVKNDDIQGTKLPESKSKKTKIDDSSESTKSKKSRLSSDYTDSDQEIMDFEFSDL